MRENEFVNWLIAGGMKESSARSRLKNCLRVCDYEGDLDVHYQRDHCKALVSRLEYSKADERNNEPARHSIDINGNVYNGTATLKAAVNLYIEFLDKMQHSVQTADHGGEREKAQFQLGNKEFAAAFARLITRFRHCFTDNDIQQLTDLGCCRVRFNCKFPILKEIQSGEASEAAFVDGYRRYYSDVFVDYSGRRFIVSNDWYCDGKTANRNLFSEWLILRLAA